MPSENHTRHIEPPSEVEQEEVEEIASDILGPRIINFPIVQFILKLQAMQMDPLEWVAGKEAVEMEPKAGVSMYLLAYLLDQDANVKANEDTEKAAAILQADKLPETFVKQ